MAASGKYGTAGALRQALEERLKAISRDERTDFQRLCRQVAFDRFLAILARLDNPDWILKGGYAMELRLDTATTSPYALLSRCKSTKTAISPTPVH